MKKIKITLKIVTFLLGLFFIFTSQVKAEVIRDFNSTINVLPDSSILVKEKITYDFEDSLRHGISRDILLHNSKSEPIEIKVISVNDDNDKIYKFTTSTSGSVFDIKIGDPDMIISGIKEYYITYKVFGSITYYDNFDEIYWNVTGNNWQVPIEKTEATVILPNNVFPITESCYYGKFGSNTKCQIIKSNIFTSEVELKANEGLTVAVGFPKGTVVVYQRKVESKLMANIKTFCPILIPVIVFIFMFIRWWRKGRDPKGKGIIIAQYDVPENLTPLLVGGIINEKIKNKNISAEIIYLATKGYIKIKQIDKDCNNLLCLISENDYEFTLLKEEGLLENTFDKKIITAIFGDNGEVGGVVLLSSLKESFYLSIPSIDNNVVDTLLAKKYYTNFPKFKIKGNLFPLIWVIGIFLFIQTYSNIQTNPNYIKNTVVLISSLIISILILLIFNRIMPARSIKGVKIKEYLLGLKEYLQIAEKDRLYFHNAPDKKPEIFENLLPYAMVFGVEELWAKEFKDIYIKSPTWYEGSKSFNVVSFGAEMAVFNSLTATLLSSTPGSSGSGGGGFSGGGGGGGGGGSW